MSRRVSIGTAVLLGVVAAAGIVLLLLADGFYLVDNLTYTAVGLMAFGVAAVAGLSATGSSWAWLGWLCVALTVAGFGILMGAAWSIEDFEDEGNVHLFNAAGTLFLFAVALADATLVLSRWGPGRDGVLRALVAATVLAVFALATLLSVAVITGTGGETYFRAEAVIAVLWALGTALIPLRKGLHRPA
jgi:hypothetical protein